MTKIHFQDTRGIAIDAQEFGNLAGVDSLYQSVLVREGVHYGFSYKVAGKDDEYVFQEKTVIEMPKNSTAMPMTKERLGAAIKEYVDDDLGVDSTTLVETHEDTVDFYFRFGADSFRVMIHPSTMPESREMILLIP